MLPVNFLILAQVFLRDGPILTTEGTEIISLLVFVMVDDVYEW